MISSYRLVLLVLAALFLAYTAWLLTLPTPYYNENFVRGRRVWQKYNCQACHQLYGLGGFLGPDLTHVVRKGGKPYLKAMVETGSPNMPVFKMNDTELSDLFLFLRGMDSSGCADPSRFLTTPDGNITPP
ncbi:MAG: cytochrome c [Bacteroidetes bacterium]|nr:cytochrome c [Bacteroidota bacterium]